MQLVSKLKELIRWKRQPMEPRALEVLPEEEDRRLEPLMTPPFFTAWPMWSDWGLSGRWPGLELEETDDEVVVRAEMPGVDPKDLNVHVQEGRLRIQYEHRTEQHNGKQGSRSVERRYRFMDNNLALPRGLDVNAARATCKHGLLTIRIPWSEDSRRRIRKIRVES